MVRAVLSAQMGKAGPPMDGRDLHFGDLDRGILPAAAPLGISTMTIAGMAIFFVNLFWSLFAGKKAPDNPWGEGATTLEWTLSSPPPFHQFSTLPKIH